MLFLLRQRLRRFATAAAAVSPSSILSPSDPSAVLNAKQKSIAALSLLKRTPNPSTSPGASVDPSHILSICRAASLSPATHVDRIALSLAVSRLAPSHPSSVRSLLSDLLLSSPTPRNVSHAIVLFGQAKLLDDALSTFRSHPSTQSLNALLLAAILAGDHPAAARFFAELPESYNLAPDAITYDTLVKSFSESGSTRSAYSLLEEMRKKNIKPDATFFHHALSGFYREQRFDEVDKLLQLMRKHECNPYSVPVYNVRIEALGKLNKAGDAKELYGEMLKRGLKPSWVTFNHMIIGFCKHGDLEEAKMLYEEMKTKRAVPRESSLHFSLVHYFCQGGDFEAALKVCEDAMAKNWVPWLKTMKTLVNGLAKAGKVEEAKKLVAQMKERFPSREEAWKEVEEGFSQ